MADDDRLLFVTEIPGRQSRFWEPPAWVKNLKSDAWLRVPLATKYEGERFKRRLRPLGCEVALRKLDGKSYAFVRRAPKAK